MPRRDSAGGDDAGVVNLGYPRHDQIGVGRCFIELTKPHDGGIRAELGQLDELFLGIGVAGPKTFKIEHGQPTQLTDGGGRCRARHRVHGRSQERQLQAVGIDLPRQIHQLGVSGTTAG